MKFLPSLSSSLALASLVLTLNACSSTTDNPANLRALYNAPMASNGPWHDYERRREAEAMTGVSGGTAPTVVPGRPTAPPPSSGLPAGTTAAPASAPAPTQATESTTGAPPAPVNPPAPAAVATPAPDAVPAPAPDVAAPAPSPAAP